MPNAIHKSGSSAFTHFLLGLLVSFLCSLGYPPILSADPWLEQRLTFDPDVSMPAYNAHCVATGSGRHVHVVWEDYRTGSEQVFYKLSTDGGSTWSADTQLVWGSSQSSEPVVAATERKVHLAWMDERNGHSEIYYKQSTDNGATWSPDIRLTSDSGDSWTPCIYALHNEVHLVWEEQKDGTFGVRYKRSTDYGVTWSQDTTLSILRTMVCVLPTISAVGSQVFVAWDDDSAGGCNNNVFFIRSTDRGMTWGPRIQLTFNPFYSGDASVAASESMVHVAWEENRDSTTEIFYKHSSDGGVSWSQDTCLSPREWDCEEPKLGTWNHWVHLVWDAEGVDPPDHVGTVYRASSDNGVTWLPTLLLNSVPNFTRSPSVSATAEGVHVTWGDSRHMSSNNNWEIYYAGTGGRLLSGVQEPTHENESCVVECRVIPNPFTSFSRVPGHSSDRFVLYDISGRRVGTYRGDRIGEGLRAGVYFLKSEKGDWKPLRIVKVR